MAPISLAWRLPLPFDSVTSAMNTYHCRLLYILALAVTCSPSATSQTVAANRSGAIRLQNLNGPPPLPSPLTPDAAVQYGLQNNPQITAGLAGVASAAAAYRSLA